MKSIYAFTLCILAISILAACQSNKASDLDVEMKSEEALQEISDTYTYADYKKLFEGIVSEANEFEKDEQLTKWIIRVLAQEQLTYETDLTDEQVINLAKREMEEDRVWKKVAKDDFGVSVTEEEVDQYIKDGPDTSELPQQQAYADALGLSMEELNHEFDRDIYEKNVLWLKLKPKLEEKYHITDNNEQVEKYDAIVRKQLS